ncbi:MAG: hypothetical protein ACPG4T_23645 [Nannocystaceae bacterium]
MSSFVRTGTTMALAALGSFAALCPGEAQATELALATDKQERAPGILKKGIYADVGVRPGTMLLEGGVIPMVRLAVSLGGALNTRFKLGTQFGFTAYLDRKKRAVGGFVTVLGTGYVWKGLYLRGGLGVASNIPVSRSISGSRAGLGGQVGLGYEFELYARKSKKKPAVRLGLGADYDIKATTTGLLRQGVLFGLHFSFN